jgi:hypothetical protein
MIAREEYNKVLDRIAVIFQELFEIVTAIKKDFDIEHRDDPYLTTVIVDFHLDVIEKYFLRYNGKSIRSTGWSLEKDLVSTKQNLRSFNREFDNPFLKSKRWYQRIVQLLGELSKESRRLDELIKEVSNSGK